MKKEWTSNQSFSEPWPQIFVEFRNKNALIKKDDRYSQARSLPTDPTEDPGDGTREGKEQEQEDNRLGRSKYPESRRRKERQVDLVFV